MGERGGKLLLQRPPRPRASSVPSFWAEGPKSQLSRKMLSFCFPRHLWSALMKHTWGMKRQSHKAEMHCGSTLWFPSCNWTYVETEKRSIKLPQRATRISLSSLILEALGVHPKRKGYNYIRYYWNLHLDFGIMFSFPLQMNHSSTEVIEFWFCFLLLFFFVFCFCNIQLWIFDNENAKH